MRLGIFGGTFDPPHLGHLLIASDAVAALQLDSLVFIPTAQQPLKLGRAAAPAEARLEMVRRLVVGLPSLSVDAIEVDRAGLSYTVDTLAEYARRYPDAERFFLLGSDAVRTFPSWREPARIASLARLVVLRRSPELADEATELEGDSMEQSLAKVQAITGSASAPITLRTRRIDVSSTEVRDRVRNGLPLRGFVTDAVARFIEASGLYR
ncbi:MAG: nicotinate-nucleotide adenylyltransferase [Gemmatimonadaceae bacterium]